MEIIKTKHIIQPTIKRNTYINQSKRFYSLWSFHNCNKTFSKSLKCHFLGQNFQMHQNANYVVLVTEKFKNGNYILLIVAEFSFNKKIYYNFFPYFSNNVFIIIKLIYKFDFQLGIFVCSS